VEKTNAKVYFSIFGDNFPIEMISKLLGLKPTHSYNKGEEIERKPNPNVTYTQKHYRKETRWELGTEYEETLDLNEQITKVIMQLESKEDVINEFCESYS